MENLIIVHYDVFTEVIKLKADELASLNDFTEFSTKFLSFFELLTFLSIETRQNSLVQNILSSLERLFHTNDEQTELLVAGSFFLLLKNTNSFSGRFQLFLEGLVKNKLIKNNELNLPLFKLLSRYVEFLKIDVNFWTLFKELQEMFLNKLDILPPTDKSFLNELTVKIDMYRRTNNEKKNYPMYFNVRKVRELQCFEPDFEYGDKNEEENVKDKKRAMEKKLKKTQKQAVRNIKNENRYIEMERAETMKEIRAKQDEDRKERERMKQETVMEYKRMMTDQRSEERLKRKKKRMAGNQVENKE